MTSGSLLPVMCLISSVPTSRCSCSASCRVLLPTKLTPSSMYCSRRSQPSLFLVVSAQCLLCGNSNCALLWRRFPKDPSRNVLFRGVQLLVSDFTRFPFGRDSPSAVYTRRVRVSSTVLVCTSHVLCRSRPHLSRHFASPALCPVQFFLLKF